MQTARVTVLMTPDRKASLEVSAKALGMSIGEYIRLALDDYRPQQTALAALVSEVNTLIPTMQDAMERSSKGLEEAHNKVRELCNSLTSVSDRVARLEGFIEGVASASQVTPRLPGG